MGENKKRVFLVGNMTIDNILSTNLYRINEIKKKLNLELIKKIYCYISSDHKYTQRNF